ncbi:hypothetical protein ACX8XP_04575 [Calditrichota bacterium LG25]
MDIILVAITLVIFLMFFLFRSYRNPHLHFFPMIAALLIFGFSFWGAESFNELFNWLDRQLQIHLGIVLPAFFYNFAIWSVNLMLLILLLIVRWILIILEKILQRLTAHKLSFPAYYTYGIRYYLLKRFNGIKTVLTGSWIIISGFVLLGISLSVNGTLNFFPLLLWAPLVAIVYEAAVYFSGEIRWIDMRLPISFEKPFLRWIDTYNKIFTMYTEHFASHILYNLIYRKQYLKNTNQSQIIDELQEQDVLITDPFNDRILSVIAETISYYLSLGKKIIVLSHDKYSLQEFYQSMNPILENELYIYSRDIYFNQTVNDPALMAYRIYFCTFDKWEDWIDTNKWNALAANTGLMIVLHPGQMYPELHAQIAQIFKKSDLPERLRMLIIAEKWQNIEESVRLLYRRSRILEVQSLQSNTFKRYLILWEGRQNYHQRVFLNVNYIPPPAILSLVPLHYGIPSIYWLDAGDFERDSIETLHGAICQQNAQIQDLNNTSVNVDKFCLQSSWRVWRTGSSRFSFIFDRFFNLPFLLNYLEKHGALELEFINILSDQYLLRSYFLANLKYFLITPHQESLFPITTWPSTSVKQVLISLLRTLSHKPLTEPELESMFFYDKSFWNKVYEFIDPKSDKPFEYTAQKINQLIAIFVENGNNTQLIKELYQWDDKNQTYVKYFPNIQVKEDQLIPNKDFSFHLAGDTDNRELLFKHIITLDNIIYHLHLNQIIILHLPDQQKDDVKAYRIENIDVDQRKVFVQHQTPQSLQILIPSVEFRVEVKIPFEKTSITIQSKEIEYRQWLCRYTRKVRKVLKFFGEPTLLPNKFQILEANNVYPESLLEKNFPIARALSIHLQLKSAESSRDFNRIAFTLSFLIQKMLKSLFPSAFLQLKVFSPQAFDLLNQQKENFPVGRGLHLLYPVVTDKKGQSFPVFGSIDIWILEESEIGMGVCEYLYNSKLSNLWDILEDFLCFIKENDAAADDLYFYVSGDERKQFPYDFDGALEIVSELNANNANSLNQRRALWDTARADHFHIINLPDRLQAGVECDFCGIKIGEKSYTELEDGRTLCEECQKTAVMTEDAFKKIMKTVYQDVEQYFSIRLPKIARISIINTADLQQVLGETFIPTPQYDPRVVGIAIHQHDDFIIMIENGAPYWNTYLTFVHELTHIWQFISLKNLNEIPLELLEGHTTYVEYALAQWYLRKREDEILQRIKVQLDTRCKQPGDVYGVGLQYFMQHVSNNYNPYFYMLELFGRQEY